MREWLKDVAEYTVAFSPDWISKMTGVASLILLLIGAVWPIKRWEVFAAAAVCYVVASFRVWQKQRRKTEGANHVLANVYSDVVLDWWQRSHVDIVSSEAVAKQLDLQPEQVTDGMGALKDLGIVKGRSNSWSIADQKQFHFHRPRYRRLDEHGGEIKMPSD